MVQWPPPALARFPLPKPGAGGYPKGMTGGGSMRNGLILLAAAALAAGCSMEIPDFLGREGGSDGYYRLGGEEPPPEPRAVALRQAEAERALHGVIRAWSARRRPRATIPRSSARSAAAPPTPPAS